MSSSRSSATTSRTPARRVCRVHGELTPGPLIRWRRNTTGEPRRGWCCSRRSATRISATPTCRTGARTTSVSPSTPGRWARWRAPAASSSWISSRRAGALRDQARPLTMQGVHLTSDGDRLIAGASERLFGRALAAGGLSHATPAGRDRQGLSLVPPVPRAERVLDVWRSRVSELRSRQSARRQPQPHGWRAEGRHPADQLRGAAAGAADSRRDDAQPRSAHLGPGARRGSEGGRLGDAAVHRREDQRAAGIAVHHGRRGREAHDDRPGAEGGAFRVGSSSPSS